MFWVILFAVGMMLSILSLMLRAKRRKSNKYSNDGYEAMTVIGAVSWILSLVVIFIMVAVTIPIYPSLNAKQEKVASLFTEISTIQNARYGNVESGKMVGGSLDNMSQSTVLSEYISNYAQAKSEYNKDVVYYQTVKKSPAFKFLGYSMFLSNDVFNLSRF